MTRLLILTLALLLPFAAGARDVCTHPATTHDWTSICALSAGSLTCVGTENSCSSDDDFVIPDGADVTGTGDLLGTGAVNAAATLLVENGGKFNCGIDSPIYRFDDVDKEATGDIDCLATLYPGPRQPGAGGNTTLDLAKRWYDGEPRFCPDGTFQSRCETEDVTEAMIYYSDADYDGSTRAAVDSFLDEAMSTAAAGCAAGECVRVPYDFDKTTPSAPADEYAWYPIDSVVSSGSNHGFIFDPVSGRENTAGYPTAARSLWEAPIAAWYEGTKHDNGVRVAAGSGKGKNGVCLTITGTSADAFWKAARLGTDTDPTDHDDTPCLTAGAYCDDWGEGFVAYFENGSSQNPLPIGQRIAQTDVNGDAAGAGANLCNANEVLLLLEEEDGILHDAAIGDTVWVSQAAVRRGDTFLVMEPARWEVVNLHNEQEWEWDDSGGLLNVVGARFYGIPGIELTSVAATQMTHFWIEDPTRDSPHFGNDFEHIGSGAISHYYISGGSALITCDTPGKGGPGEGLANDPCDKHQKVKWSGTGTLVSFFDGMLRHQGDRGWQFGDEVSTTANAHVERYRAQFHSKSARAAMLGQTSNALLGATFKTGECLDCCNQGAQGVPPGTTRDDAVFRVTSNDPTTITELSVVGTTCNVTGPLDSSPDNAHLFDVRYVLNAYPGNGYGFRAAEKRRVLSRSNHQTAAQDGNPNPFVGYRGDVEAFLSIDDEISSTAASECLVGTTAGVTNADWSLAVLNPVHNNAGCTTCGAICLNPRAGVTMRNILVHWDPEVGMGNFNYGLNLAGSGSPAPDEASGIVVSGGTGTAVINGSTTICGNDGALYSVQKDWAVFGGEMADACAQGLDGVDGVYQGIPLQMEGPVVRRMNPQADATVDFPAAVWGETKGKLRHHYWAQDEPEIARAFYTESEGGSLRSPWPGKGNP